MWALGVLTAVGFVVLGVLFLLRRRRQRLVLDRHFLDFCEHFEERVDSSLRRRIPGELERIRQFQIREDAQEGDA